ncbi:MAG TPA: RNA polymerase sigma factor [Dermatophilaceae bacterium]|nr:RNA polymerase sigma factor [Dermatophilaceae bacterium]
MEPLPALGGVLGVKDSTRTSNDAVRDLYEGCYTRLVGVVSLAADSRAEAEECVQEAFIRLLREWPTVSQFDSPEAWTRRVALRLLSNRRRKARNGIKALLRAGPARTTQEPTGDSLDIRRALERLPLGQRQVVVLHYLVGLGVAEVAAELAIAPGTVKSRLSRARDALSPLLREEALHG